MRRLLRRPYVFWVLGIFVAYMALNVTLSQFYITVRFMHYYAQTLNWPELVLSALFSIAIGALIAMNAALGYIRMRERGPAVKEGALACAGTFAGLSTGVCSACVTGFAPVVLSALGLTAGFVGLPFKGIEIQVLTILVLSVNLRLLGRM